MTSSGLHVVSCRRCRHISRCSHITRRLCTYCIVLYISQCSPRKAFAAGLSVIDTCCGHAPQTTSTPLSNAMNNTRCLRYASDYLVFLPEKVGADADSSALVGFLEQLGAVAGGFMHQHIAVLRSKDTAPVQRADNALQSCHLGLAVWNCFFIQYEGLHTCKLGCTSGSLFPPSLELAP